MFYREAGQFKTSYAADQAIFPILQDRIGIGCHPGRRLRAFRSVANDFIVDAIMIPFLIFALAAIGLNLLTGYAGQISLGTGAFMGVGAYACYKLTTIFPDVNIVILILVSGFFCGRDRRGLRPAVPAHQGLLSGGGDAGGAVLPGVVLHPHRLALQLQPSGAIEVPTARVVRRHHHRSGGHADLTRYFIVLAIVVAMTWLASNLMRGRIGRSWMMVRDMDIAAELMGIRPAADQAARLCGVVVLLRRRRARCMVFLWFGAAEPLGVRHQPGSFQVLFMVIIGGLGSLIGSYLGAAFIWSLPIILRVGAGTDRHCRSARRPSSTSRSHHRRADHLLPDRRAARPRPAVADRQAEAEGLAVSVLKCANGGMSKRGIRHG